MEQELFSTQEGAKQLGINPPAFRMRARRANLEPVKVIQGKGSPQKFWTAEQIATIAGNARAAVIETEDTPGTVAPVIEQAAQMDTSNADIVSESLPPITAKPPLELVPIENLIVDPEFRDLIPPLEPDEFRQLEENILRHGIQDPLKTWQGVIVDGHNRYKIARAHDLHFKTLPMEFADRDDVKIWIIQNQCGRRNLSAYARTALALKLKPVISAKAKEQQIRKSADFVLQNSAEQTPIDTRQEIAKAAGVSHDTVAKVEFLEQHATTEIKDALKAGKLSVNKAYKGVKAGAATVDAVKEFKAKRAPALPHEDTSGTLFDLGKPVVPVVTDDTHEEPPAPAPAVTAETAPDNKDDEKGLRSMQTPNDYQNMTVVTPAQVKAVNTIITTTNDLHVLKAIRVSLTDTLALLDAKINELRKKISL